MTPLGRIKNFTADTAIGKRRIVKFGASEGRVAQADGAAGLLGVSGVRGADAGARIDVYLSDIQPVELGGAVAYGDWLTSDANGKAIVAAPAEGVTMEVIGRAMAAAGAGAIIDADIAPQQITG